jgi:prolipoprotein diacylglyceryltransferase
MYHYAKSPNVYAAYPCLPLQLIYLFFVFVLLVPVFLCLDTDLVFVLHWFVSSVFCLGYGLLLLSWDAP